MSDGPRRPPLLPPCPRSPNCVSSLAGAATSRVAPLRFEGGAEEAAARLRAALARLPGARVVEDSGARLRVEVRTRWLRFVDDLELVAVPSEGVFHVRSASRVGWSDLGANRRRVERLRRLFEASPREPPDRR
jgi:uncharacterized protein (DUF1499 family)